MLTAKQFFAIIFFSFVSYLPLSAQEKMPQLTWGSVKIEDLQLKSWRTDSTTPACVLGDVGTLSMQLVQDYYGFRLKQHRRVKILKKEGFSYQNVAIPYYSKDETQSIVSIRAQTIAPNGDKFAVEKAAIVHESLNNGWTIAKFTFPEITEGCIVEYEYDLQSTRSVELHEWFFQDKIPTRFSILNLDVLARYQYIHLIQGKENLTISTPKSDSTGQQHIHTVYYAKDLPGLVKEQYVSHINNHLTQIHFKLANYTGINGTKHEILSTWPKMASDLWENEYFGQKISKKSNYNQVIEAAKDVVKSGDAVKVKAQKLYDFVNKNIQWDSNYYLLSVNTPNDVWQKRKGGSTELNLTLLALLKNAGVDAHPILVSTQAHGKAMPEHPVLDQFDHALVFVDLGNDKSLVLDAGDAMRQIGLPSEQASNGKGWLMKKDEQTWVDLKPTMNAQMVVAKFDITNNGHLNGTLTTNYRNHLSAEHRNSYDVTSDKPEMSRIEYLKTQYPNLRIDDLKCLNCDKKQEPLKEMMTCTVLDVVKTDKNLMYIHPMLKTDWDVNPFKLINRAYPVEFASPLTEQYVAMIAIPEGYKVEELPRDLTLSMPQEGLLFDYQISNDSDKFIKLAVKLQINKTVFVASEYDDLKAIFRQVAHKFTQKVVLKRAAQ